MSHRRRLFAALLALPVFAIACGGASSTSGTSSSGPVTVHIAHLADLTGQIKDANKVQIEGMNIALDEINNDRNSKFKIVIDRQDTGADPTKALAEMKDVADNSQEVLQIGPPSSTEFFAAIPQAEKLKLPILSQVAGGYYSGTFNSYVFRTSFPDTSAMPALIDYAKSKGAKKLGSVYANDSDSPRTNGEQMAKMAQSKGLTVTSYSFSTKDVDFSAQTSKLASDKPDVLFVSVLPAQLPFVLKAIKAAGISSKIISTSSVFSGDLKAIYSNSGGAADGVVVSTAFDPNSSRTVVRNYVAKFNQLYPGQSISFDVYGYDAVHIIYQALTKVQGQVTRESLRKAFAKVNYDGLTGTGITFPNGYGDVSRRTVSLKAFSSPGVLTQDAP